MSAHHHHSESTPRSVLLWTILIIAGFAGLEAMAGWYSGSLALLSDAGHMVTDTFNLVIAWVASWIASKPGSHKHTYGLGRAEVIGGWFSSLLIVIVAIVILIEAVERFREVHPVTGSTVMAVAFIGLLVNVFAGWLVSRGERTINIRAALLHILGDILASVAALISGALIYFTGWMLIDPILSVFISLLILFSAVQLLRESFLVLMEGVPPHIDVSEVGQAMTAVEGVLSIHDLHIWTLSSGQFILTAHVEIEHLDHWHAILDQLSALLKQRYGIGHVTLQPEVHATMVPIPSARTTINYKKGQGNDRDT